MENFISNRHTAQKKTKPDNFSKNHENLKVKKVFQKLGNSKLKNKI